jgi:hypothetical protein
MIDVGDDRKIAQLWEIGHGFLQVRVQAVSRLEQRDRAAQKLVVGGLVGRVLEFVFFVELAFDTFVVEVVFRNASQAPRGALGIGGRAAFVAGGSRRFEGDALEGSCLFEAPVASLFHLSAPALTKVALGRIGRTVYSPEHIPSTDTRVTNDSLRVGSQVASVDG